MKKIDDYLLKANDIEKLSNSSILIIIENKSILLKNVTVEFIDKCYERFGEKFKNSNRKSNKKVIWNEDEIEYLKVNYLNKIKMENIESKINKSSYQVNLMLQKLKLIEKKKWTKSELEFLEINKDKDMIWLANKLKRSYSSVKAKRRIIINKNM